MGTTILQADLTQINLVAPLFDAYRIFYGQASDLSKATAFLKERITKEQSVIFLALTDGNPSGFTQLYTSFSSVSMQPLLILNDLYVDAKYRNMGIGSELLNHAKNYCKKLKYKGLSLETAIDNPAQKLYEKLDWKKDTDCFHYFWTAG
jgi:ribosomal protein S18 acetylase RimI-like enzyme